MREPGPYRYDPDDEPDPLFVHYEGKDMPDLEVVERPNPVVGTLLGPDGEVLIEITERRYVPFGYC